MTLPRPIFITALGAAMMLGAAVWNPYYLIPSMIVLGMGVSMK